MAMTTSSLTLTSGTAITANGSVWINAGAVGSVATYTVPAGKTATIAGFNGTAKTYIQFALKTNGVERAWGRIVPSTLNIDANVTITDLTAGDTALLTASPDWELETGSRLIYGNLKIFEH